MTQAEAKRADVALQRLKRLLLGLDGADGGVRVVEWCALLVAAAVFWSPEPTRVWALALLPPIFLLRRWRHGRWLTRTPLDVWWLVFLALCVINLYAAPYTRGWLMLGRPLLGLALVYSLVDDVRRFGVGGVRWLTSALALLVALLALLSSQWTGKSAAFQGVIDGLPRLDLPYLGRFNVNEIGGALAWLMPLALALWFSEHRRGRGFALGTAVMVGTAALLLGQSRAALVGAFVGFVLVIWLLLNGRRRVIALAVLTGLVALQGAVLIDTSASTDAPLAGWNADSSDNRRQIYESALAIVRDYPLTGVGLNMFRASVVRERYPVPNLAGRVVPHAHNETLQIASDLGVPGVLVYVGWHGALAWALWRTAGRGGGARIFAVGAGAGLLAHGVYGLVDAVPLWDRFAFVYWWVVAVGLAGWHSDPVSSP